MAGRKPKDPSPRFPQEQRAAGIAAVVGVGATLLSPILDIDQQAQSDIVLMTTTYGSSVIGAGTIIRWRRIGNDKIVQDSINRADRDGDGRPDWQELPLAYGGLILGGVALAVALAALLLLLL